MVRNNISVKRTEPRHRETHLRHVFYVTAQEVGPGKAFQVVYSISVRWVLLHALAVWVPHLPLDVALTQWSILACIRNGQPASTHSVFSSSTLLFLPFLRLALERDDDEDDEEAALCVGA